MKNKLIIEITGPLEELNDLAFAYRIVKEKLKEDGLELTYRIEYEDK